VIGTLLVHTLHLVVFLCSIEVTCNGIHAQEMQGHTEQICGSERSNIAHITDNSIMIQNIFRTVFKKVGVKVASDE
jgi:hypothetical protein